MSDSESDISTYLDPYFSSYGGIENHTDVLALKYQLRDVEKEINAARNDRQEIMDSLDQLTADETASNDSQIAEMKRRETTVIAKYQDLLEARHQIMLKLEATRKDLFYDTITPPKHLAAKPEPKPVKKVSPPHPRRTRNASDSSVESRNGSSRRSRTRNLAKPSPFQSGDDITLFFDRFREFVTLGRIRDKNLHLYLLNLVKDDKMYRKLRSVKLSSSQQSDVDSLIKAYEEFLFPATETRLLRSSMSTLAQKKGESISDFVLRIEEIGSKAYSDYTLKEEASLSALIAGVASLGIRQKLLESDTNTFEDASRLATKLERIDTTLAGGKLQSEEQSLEFDVLRVNNTDNGAAAFPNSSSSSRPQSYPVHTTNPSSRHVTFQPNSHRGPRGQVRCYGCNELGHIRRNCPNSNRRSTYPHHTQSGLRSVTCYYCNQVGHYASHCTQRQQNNPRPLIPRPPPVSNPASDVTTSATTSAPESQPDLNSNPAGRYPIHPSRL